MPKNITKRTSPDSPVLNDFLMVSQKLFSAIRFPWGYRQQEVLS